MYKKTSANNQVLASLRSAEPRVVPKSFEVGWCVLPPVKSTINPKRSLNLHGDKFVHIFVQIKIQNYVSRKCFRF